MNATMPAFKLRPEHRKAMEKIHPEVRQAMQAIELPEVQEMLKHLSKYGLAIAVPHMHGEDGDFLPLPKNKVSVEFGLEVSFKDADHPEAQDGLPVMWRCVLDDEMNVAEMNVAAACPYRCVHTAFCGHHHVHHRRQDPSPVQLKVLAPLVGQWKTEALVKFSPTLRPKDAFTSKGETTCQWVHDGQFLRLETFGVSQHGRFEQTTMISFDPTTKQFRQFGFSTDGIDGEAVGEWDANARTLTMKSVKMPSGLTAFTTMTIENNQLFQTLVVKNDIDKVMREVTSTSSRA